MELSQESDSSAAQKNIDILNFYLGQNFPAIIIDSCTIVAGTMLTNLTLISSNNNPLQLERIKSTLHPIMAKKTSNKYPPSIALYLPPENSFLPPHIKITNPTDIKTLITIAKENYQQMIVSFLIASRPSPTKKNPKDTKDTPIEQFFSDPLFDSNVLRIIFDGLCFLPPRLLPPLSSHSTIPKPISPSPFWKLSPSKPLEDSKKSTKEVKNTPIRSHCNIQ